MKRYAFGIALAVGAAISLLAGCGGGGTGSVVPSQPGSTSNPATPTPVPTATPTPPGASTQTIETRPGAVIGETGQFSPAEGDASGGGSGTPVDNIMCDTSMSNNYHIHFYLGVFVNGKQVALPAGVGMVDPQPPDNTGFVNIAQCFYHIHTHDQSGVIHIEDPNPNNLAIQQPMYTLKDLFDIWGVTVNAGQFGSFSGPVRVFTTGQTYRGGASQGDVPASDLTFYGTDANAIPLYSYEVIYIEVGPSYPSTLPNVHFYEVH